MNHRAIVRRQRIVCNQYHFLFHLRSSSHNYILSIPLILSTLFISHITVKHNGSITMDQVIQIARKARDRSLARTLAGTVKEVLGSCVSVGCSVNDQSPKDLFDKIDSHAIAVPDE